MPARKLLILLLFLFAGGCTAKNQKQTEKDQVVLPSFNMQLAGSKAIFNTSAIPRDRPIILIYFAPDCEVCQEETKLLITNINALSNAQLYFLTLASFEKIDDFISAYSLQQYKNILIARDIDISFKKIFDAPAIPFIAVYNKSKVLIATYKGGVKPDKLIAAVNK